MTTTISGSTGVNQITDDAITDAKLPAGSVLQVVHGNLPTTVVMSGSTSWTDVSGLLATITPSSTTSKILIIASITLAKAGHAHARMVRGSTPVGNGTGSGSREGVFAYGNNSGGVNSTRVDSYSYLDSPSTTSATTYKIQINNTNDSGACYVNRTQGDTNAVYGSRGVSSITLMEIAG
jgi:hypothetical protein